MIYLKDKIISLVVFVLLFLSGCPAPPRPVLDYSFLDDPNLTMQQKCQKWQQNEKLKSVYGVYYESKDFRIK